MTFIKSTDAHNSVITEASTQPRSPFRVKATIAQALVAHGDTAAHDTLAILGRSPRDWRRATREAH